MKSEEQIDEEKKAEDEAIEDLDDNFVTIEGLIISNNFDHLLDIVDEENINKFSLKQRQCMSFEADIQFFIDSAKDLFDEVKETKKTSETHLIVHASHQSEDEGILIIHKNQRLELSWITSPKNDMIADTLVLLALQLPKNPPSQVLLQIHKDSKDDKKTTIIDVLTQHCEKLKFGDLIITQELNKDEEMLTKVRELLKKEEQKITVLNEEGESVACLDLTNYELECENDEVKSYLVNLIKLTAE